MIKQGTKHSEIHDRDKFLIATAVLLLLVILLIVFQGNKITINEEKETINGFGVQKSDVKIELFTGQNSVSSQLSSSDLETRVFYMQFAFLFNDMPDCYHGMVKTQKLFESGFHAEALFEYATVMHSYLTKRIIPYSFPRSQPKFITSIGIAFKHGLINSEQRKFLHKLRKLRNKKAHQPGVDFPEEIAALYLNSGFNLIESYYI